MSWSSTLEKIRSVGRSQRGELERYDSNTKVVNIFKNTCTRVLGHLDVRHLESFRVHDVRGLGASPAANPSFSTASGTQTPDVHIRVDVFGDANAVLQWLLV